jgi:four helix bundle protein
LNYIKKAISERWLFGDRQRFCDNIHSSASELEYQLLLARDLKLIHANDYEQPTQQTTEIKRMLTVFVRKLRADI